MPSLVPHGLPSCALVALVSPAPVYLASLVPFALASSVPTACSYAAPPAYRFDLDREIDRQSHLELRRSVRWGYGYIVNLVSG
ncbi:hypothetical protein EDB19DRAFT_1817957, partial [Suillus lakei]